MNRWNPFAVGLCFVVIVGLLMGSGANAGPPPGKLAVIVAKDSPVKNLTREELKRIFLSDAVIVAGRKLVPFNFAPGTPARKGFDKSLLGMTEDAMQRFWIDRKVRGQPGAPRGLPSTLVVIGVTAKFPGAIAYVPAHELTAEVQAVTIDGVPHTSPAYTITE